MPRTRGARASRESASDDAPVVGWVMCAACEEWVKLDNTPFETVEEADAAASYRCHKCEALRILREEFALLIKLETEKWHLTVENVKAKCKEESDKATAERRALLAVLAVEKDMRVALMTQIEELQQALQNRDTTIRRCDPTLTDGSPEAEDAGSAHAKVVVTSTDKTLENNSIHNMHQEKSQATDTPKRQVEENEGRASKHGHGRKHNLNRKERKKTHPKPSAPVPTQEAPVPTQGADPSQVSPNSMPCLKKPEPRLAFVLGDGNAHRLRYAVSRATKRSRLVKFRTKRDATLQDVMRDADAADDVWSSPEAIIIIHAGLQDIAYNDVPLKELAQQLTDAIAAWKKRTEKHLFVLYGVPEIPGEAVLNGKCRHWNDLVKLACTELGPRVEFVRAPHMAQESRQGLVYNDTTAEEMGQRLGRRLCTFLGFRPSYATQHRPWVDKSGVAPFMAALGQIMLQMAGPKQVKPMRHPHRFQR
ncbi:hypothetical protein HPB52_003224 [Rhipicephalus sanguineus]|uniref:Uncharacterized protein n=1 Tax=Rhipicephalus sanguineus TaxID=34632 RepID=A0A9D4T598_RHISA|nr:hypothetical protein HPB52_003224 [Rhipicephalus sanguineus]